MKLHYVAIEGVIGVGKTTLVTFLAQHFSGRAVLEQPEENPFLEDFYRNPRQYAFQTQLFFLLSRYWQQQNMAQRELFHEILFSDYLFAKDKIFAYLNLEDRELLLYEKIWTLLEKDIPLPDLVVYLKSTPERLLSNIRSRGRTYERDISEQYIRDLNEAYNRFFAHYTDTPLLVLDTTEMDFVTNKPDFEQLVDKLLRYQSEDFKVYD